MLPQLISASPADGRSLTRSSSSPSRSRWRCALPLPGTDLDAGPAGLGVALWLRVDDAQALHDRLRAAGVPVLTSPSEGPFGLHFAFSDPDGYTITVHE
ncbi:VOC family protein [Microbacterium gorillae]|uniref:VOC family protein n=1 Tax=Microbacterium gorillae TaxID=1231063 RepID=UPI002DDD72CC|nr:VOC family protein [Microbacterium gorillae]